MSSLVPPFRMETMCSISKVSGEKSSGVWQYSHKNPARCAIISRLAAENLGRGMAVFLDAQLFGQRI